MPFDKQYKRNGPDAFGPTPAKRLGLVSLVAVTFFTVSGGAYGLEPLVGAVGPSWAIVLVLLTPLLWSLPIALMVAELASAMPEEGGYFRWACEGLGRF
jgi:amino acid transporter